MLTILRKLGWPDYYQLLRLKAIGDFGDQTLAVEEGTFLGIIVLVDSGTVRVLKFFEVPEYVPESMLCSAHRGKQRETAR